jgi:RNA polymerase sigma factor (sigma-70 family)
MDEQSMDIAGLVGRSAAGDRAAFAQLIQFHERTALAIAYGTVGCAATAADVVQEAFLRAWQRLGELDEPARFAGWFGRIVRNLAVDALRRRPRAEVAVESEQLAAVPSAPGADRLEKDETRRQVSAALAELDEVTRMTVTLRYYQNLSSRQIGELVGLSPAAVDMRLSRARSQLRDRLMPAASSGDLGDSVAGAAVDTLACGGGAAAAGGLA